MRPFYLLCLLVPVGAIAQDSEHYLKSCATVLAMNRQVPDRFFFASKREQARQDTVSASGVAYRIRAIKNVWQHDYEQAAILLEKTGNLYPKENGIIGEIYLSKLHDYPRALHHFDAYDALTPTFDDIVGYNPVSYLQGLAYRNMGNHVKALEQFSRAIDSLAIKHGSEWVNYRQYVSRAVSYIATQQSEKALADLGHAAKNFTRSALVQYHRGRALLQLHRTAEAQTAFQDASFFFKALRVERTGDSQEDDFNPIYEPEIDEALANLKNQSR